jgi:hypothetical protein
MFFWELKERRSIIFKVTQYTSERKTFQHKERLNDADKKYLFDGILN